MTAPEWKARIRARVQDNGSYLWHWSIPIGSWVEDGAPVPSGHLVGHASSYGLALRFVDGLLRGRRVS